MNVYLCGQKAFGKAALDVILGAGHQVVGVSAPLTSEHDQSRPDRLRAAADDLSLPVLPAGMLSVDTLPAGVDLIVAAHSHDFIGRRTRLKSAYGAVGFHPSLLPLHRGRDAVRWTIKMGDRISGGSMYWLDDNIDAGPLAAQEWVWVPPGSTAEQLWRDHLFPLGLRLLERVLSDVSDGVIISVPQDDDLATWEPSWERCPLRRPNLLLLGDGRPGFRSLKVRRDAAALRG